MWVSSLRSPFAWRYPNTAKLAAPVTHHGLREGDSRTFRPCWRRKPITAYGAASGKRP